MDINKVDLLLKYILAAAGQKGLRESGSGAYYSFEQIRLFGGLGLEGCLKLTTKKLSQKN